MLVNLKEMLAEAERKQYAVASINTINLETLQAVVWAAEEVGTGVIINHAQGSENLVRLEEIAPYMLEYAKKAKVPIAVHVDHGYDFDFCMRAIRAGFTSIMFDQSRLPIADNIANTKAFVKMVRPLGISVEAELGEMPNNMPCCVKGQEKSDLSDITRFYTHPEDAIHFAEETGVDVLAISVGTIHGMYESEPNLDIKRIRTIYKCLKNKALETHLCIHGGSGLNQSMIHEAVFNGVRKINYFTDMDTSVAPVLLKAIRDAHGKPVNYSILVNIARETMMKSAIKAIKNMMPGNNHL